MSTFCLLDSGRISPGCSLFNFRATDADDPSVRQCTFNVSGPSGMQSHKNLGVYRSILLAEHASALIMTDNYQPKAAYRALQNVLANP